MIRALALLILVCAITTLVTAQSPSGTSQDVIAQARRAYYNLAEKRFYGFKAVIEPDWEVILGSTATPENLKVFRAVQLSMTVDGNGVVVVNHEVADSEQTKVEPYVKPIHENVQRLLSGFFGTWARFMVSSPFPDAQTQSKIENSGNAHRIFYSTETNDVLLTMTNELLITEWKLTSTRAKRTLKPLFQKTEEGLLLNGYQTDFEPVAEGIRTTLDFTIGYQDVSGMRLPHKIRINGIHGGQPVAAKFTFSQYTLIPTKDNP